MWSFFTRDAVKDFPYEISNETEDTDNFSIWKLHQGKKKASGEVVSVFVFEVNSAASQSMLETAKAAVKRLKTLRHPSILTYVDSLETEKLVYLVTELVVPLKQHLSKLHSLYSTDQAKLAISWGLHEIAQALGFLNKDCNLSHNNVCLSSVYVDRAGEWRLGGVEYMAPVQDPRPVKSIPELQKYDPPEGKSSSRVKSNNWSHDSWGLGCLVWETFNETLPQATSLKSPNKIPSSLVPHYCELTSANPSARPSSLDFLKKASKEGGYFKNKFIEVMLFLREIHIKENEEKIQFFNNLSSVLDSFPQDICKYKVLPELLNAFEFGNAGSSVLTPLFKLGKSLSDEEYQQKVVPCIVKMFSSKDRATRVKLLQKMEEFINYLQPSVINNQLFPSIAQGFLDTSPVIRDETIRCMQYLASKLNNHNLNEEMLKHFARLQIKDEQGGIRTNTTVCLGRIACHLSPETRKKVLANAFLRGLRDPFPPARFAAILALSATECSYGVNECATKILPALCVCTIDPEKKVRTQAFKAISGFLEKLQLYSEDPTKAAEEEDSKISALATSWTAWAFSSLTDKLYKTSAKSSSNNASLSSSPDAQTGSESCPVNRMENSDSSSDVQNNKQETYVSGNYDNSWDVDDWKDIDDEPPCDAKLEEIKDPCKSSAAEHIEWDVDGWESFNIVDSLGDASEDKPKLSSYFQTSQSEDDPFMSIHSVGIKDRSTVSKSQSGEWGIQNTDWDSWEENKPKENTRTAERTAKSAEERRIFREERRKQRLKEKSASKPMKLGAQKLT